MAEEFEQWRELITPVEPATWAPRFFRREVFARVHRRTSAAHPTRLAPTALYSDEPGATPQEFASYAARSAESPVQ